MNYTATELQLIKDNYAQYGAKYCAEKLNRSYAGVVAKAKYLGLKISKELRKQYGIIAGSKSKTRPKTAKHIDLEQFNNINSKEIAYILGILWADGYVHPYKVSITLLKDDMLELLPIFRKVGDWSSQEHQFNRYKVLCRPTIIVYAANKRLADILIANDYSSKNFESADKILSKIPEDLHRYWFRALIDGDGYIWYSKKGMYKITITSSKEQNWNYMEELCKKLNIRYSINRDSWTNKQGKISSRSVFLINNFYGVKTLCEYIYQNKELDNIGFSRKYKKWLEIKEFIQHREEQPNQTAKL